jgi:hypothetical protein
MKYCTGRYQNDFNVQGYGGPGGRFRSSWLGAADRRGQQEHQVAEHLPVPADGAQESPDLLGGGGGCRVGRRESPRASLSLSADIHMNVLNNSYDRICIFEHVQWRWHLVTDSPGARRECAVNIKFSGLTVELGRRLRGTSSQTESSRPPRPPRPS